MSGSIKFVPDFGKNNLTMTTSFPSKLSVAFACQISSILKPLNSYSNSIICIISFWEPLVFSYLHFQHLNAFSDTSRSVFLKPAVQPQAFSFYLSHRLSCSTLKPKYSCMLRSTTPLVLQHWHYKQGQHRAIPLKVLHSTHASILIYHY